jgi:hypothetical protein
MNHLHLKIKLPGNGLMPYSVYAFHYRLSPMESHVGTAVLPSQLRDASSEQYNKQCAGDGQDDRLDLPLNDR